MTEPRRQDAPVYDRAAAIYEQTGWLRAAVALVPSLGSSIDAIITTRAQNLARQRIEAFLSELQAASSRLDAEKLDRAYLESEEWSDLVLRAFRAAADTRDREKSQLYAALLADAATTDRIPEIDYEAALSSIAELSVQEVALARAIFDKQVGEPGDAFLEAPAGVPGGLAWVKQHGWDEIDLWAPSGTRENLTFHLKRIERTGLIAEITGAYFDYAGGAYGITATFRKIMATLREASESTSST